MPTIRLKNLTCTTTRGGPLKLKCQGSVVWTRASMSPGQTVTVGHNHSFSNGSPCVVHFHDDSASLFFIPAALSVSTPRGLSSHRFNGSGANFNLTYDVV